MRTTTSRHVHRAGSRTGWVLALFGMLGVCSLVAETPPALKVPEATITEEKTPPKAAEAGTKTAKEPTVVTSERLQVDYAHNVGTFEGNVLAVDPRITIRADKMVVTFGGGTNQTARTIQKMNADGGVIITQDKRKATSDHAEYTSADGKVLLTGNPRVDEPGGSVSGERITFWQGQDKMDVENSTRTIIYPDEDKKKDQSPAPAKDAP